MTRNNEYPENSADKALESWNGIQRAEANPFIFTRIMARIEQKKNGWEKMAKLMARPIIAMSLTALFITADLWVVVKQHSKHLIKADTEQSLAEEYATVSYFADYKTQ